MTEFVLAGRRAFLLVAAVPAVGMLPSLPFTADGEQGVFQADLVGLVLAVGLSAFVVRTTPRGLLSMAAAALLCAAMHAGIAGSLGGAASVALLVLAAALAASGLAAVGRRLGCPRLTAGAVAAAVLWVAMTGLLWVDDFADALPREQRYAFRQAVLHVDLATACAYDGASFDRFHEPRIYRELPVASSIVHAPSAGTTGLAWLLLGLVAWGVAWLLGRSVPRSSTRA